MVAEKYQALVNLGMANSRMKDFYDLWIIARKFDFDGLILSEAIHKTFSRRRTTLQQHTPSGLSARFYDDAQKNTQWNAFLQKGRLVSSPLSLTEVCRLLETFLLPPTQALTHRLDFSARWEPGGPWS